MATRDVAERAYLTHLDKNGTLRVPSKRHSSLEKHIGSRLWCRQHFGVRLSVGIPRLKVRDFIGSHKNDNRRGVLESSVQYLTDVGRTFTCQLDCRRPLHWRKIDAPKEIKHRFAKSVISPVHDEY